MNAALQKLKKTQAGLYENVLEWIAEGWGLEGEPTPEQIAAALLMEANTQDEWPPTKDKKWTATPSLHSSELRQLAYEILDCAHKPIWVHIDNLRSYIQGWAIFFVDDGESHYQIQKLDDPEGVCAEHDLRAGLGGGKPDWRAINHFKSDAEAVRWVRKQAKTGESTCQKALDFLAAQKNRR